MSVFFWLFTHLYLPLVSSSLPQFNKILTSKTKKDCLIVIFSSQNPSLQLDRAIDNVLFKIRSESSSPLLYLPMWISQQKHLSSKHLLCSLTIFSHKYTKKNSFHLVFNTLIKKILNNIAATPLLLPGHDAKCNHTFCRNIAKRRTKPHNSSKFCKNTSHISAGNCQSAVFRTLSFDQKSSLGRFSCTSTIDLHYSVVQRKNGALQVCKHMS